MDGQVSVSTRAARAWSASRAPATSRVKSWFDVGRPVSPPRPAAVIAAVAACQARTKVPASPRASASAQAGTSPHDGLTVPAPLFHSERSGRPSSSPPKWRKKSAWKPDGTETRGSPHSLTSTRPGYARSSQSRVSRHSRPVSTRPGSSLTREAAMSTRKPATPRSNQCAMISRTADRLARGPGASTGWRHGSSGWVRAYPKLSAGCTGKKFGR